MEYTYSRVSYNLFRSTMLKLTKKKHCINIIFYIFHLKEEFLSMLKGKSEDLLFTGQQFKNTEPICSALLTSLHKAVTVHQK